jgi:hypothetical protein
LLVFSPTKCNLNLFSALAWLLSSECYRFKTPDILALNGTKAVPLNPSSLSNAFALSGLLPKKDDGFKKILRGPKTPIWWETPTPISSPNCPGGFRVGDDGGCIENLPEIDPLEDPMKDKPPVDYPMDSPRGGGDTPTTDPSGSNGGDDHGGGGGGEPPTDKTEQQKCQDAAFLDYVSKLHNLNDKYSDKYRAFLVQQMHDIIWEWALFVGTMGLNKALETIKEIERLISLISMGDMVPHVQSATSGIIKDVPNMYESIAAINDAYWGEAGTLANNYAEKHLNCK